MLSKIFACTLVICCAFAILSLSAQAQTRGIQPNPIKPIEDIGDPNFNEDDPIIVSLAESTATAEELKPSKSLLLKTVSPFAKFQPLLSAAIDQRLGSPYHWGSTGPRAFDCSGFVWSTFHSAGIDFERANARTLWARFAPATADEKFKFGTLVFFSGLRHVGIVADEHGFYHASRHHGVVYAEFKGYWLKHIDGFRRVPLPAPPQHTD